ncbi:MAG: hypothetical protein HN712_06780 [Gemmatimonadetes bacterium]|jgi:4-amino-4-deoxy-L-arabinose transferase-like glycosyltransferase|nr:hypothetical protein [Gemmatimonadota bacterium]MBT6147477.1 hypothetical protein [Gemmatimonadota bacterium]MBT7860000.1 hypothetical protein [Gemmatimonadota bacterium]
MKWNIPWNLTRSDLARSDLAARLTGYLDGWGGPVLAALLALLLCIWTFDPKLSLSGDNGEFITLARSLASGQGLTYTHLPLPQVATKFPPGFPLLLAPAAALFETSSWAGYGIRDFTVMKWIVVLIFTGSAACLFLLSRDLSNSGRATVTTLVAVSNPLIVSYGYQVMSEVPYIMWSLLSLWLLHRGLARTGWRENGWLWSGIAAMILAYYTRTIGICLIAAVVTHLAIHRDWRRMLAVGAVSVAAILPWSIRNSQAGGNAYMQDLFLRNPYRPDEGYLDAVGMLLRMKIHLVEYVSVSLPETILPAFARASDVLSGLGFVIVLLGIATIVQCVRRRRHSLIVIYAAFFIGTLLIWPWSGTRFILPLVPLLIFLAVDSITEGILWIRGHILACSARAVAAMALLLMLAVNVDALNRYARFSKVGYPREWRTYFEAGLWLRTMTPSDVIVGCRKALLMHVVSGRRTTTFAFTKPQALLADLRRQRVNYVVVDQIGYSQTEEFLVPAILTAKDHFREMHRTGDPETWIIYYDETQPGQ